MVILYAQEENGDESGYYISKKNLTLKQTEIMEFLINKKLTPISKIKESGEPYSEIGPHTTFKSPWCSNALSILARCGVVLDKIEKTHIYNREVDDYDKMLYTDYKNIPVEEKPVKPKKPKIVSIMGIKKFGEENNLNFDDDDIKIYINLFKSYRRSPTDVELHDLAQSNSEHSRHWFFNGNIQIKKNGCDRLKICDKTLMDHIKSTQRCDSNSLISIKDNASVIKGFRTSVLSPRDPSKTSPYDISYVDMDIAFTAETHNFPTGVAPFPGAATGTGGRIRDNQAVGRGGYIIAGTVGYCVGNLNIPGYKLLWEDEPLETNGVCSPLDIEIHASNGASDYGNKIGEPVINGFTRSFGMTLPTGERVEWAKPIMFSGGIGMIQHRHINKYNPYHKFLIIRLGGPAYRIGMGGGAASSKIQESDKNLDAVQRGDPQMENRLNRMIRSCIELGEDNPILSIHDQGAGGMANVTKEICSPNGGIVNIANITNGDETLSLLEKWVSEYQEQVTILTSYHYIEVLKSISKRENCPLSVTGYITNTGRIEVYDSSNPRYDIPVNLNLHDVVEAVPRKTYLVEENYKLTRPFCIPEDQEHTLSKLVGRVFRLLSVGSKRFLTNKVDRSVTGLVAQQQCVGPYHTPLSNVAVVAQSHYNTVGMATAIGEQPIKGLISPSAMARMSVGEMLTNLVWCKITKFSDIKCSGNWMWPGKDKFEGFHLYKAVKAFSNVITELGLGIDGGKDSLSMVVKSKDKLVKSPGSLVVSGYAPCSNINKIITPDMKDIDSDLVYIDLGCGKYRMGGSSLAHVFKEVGDISPDIISPSQLERTFTLIQGLIDDGLILSGHDRSDGGLITTILEMCMAGDKGAVVNIESDVNLISYMFAEELGMVLEVNCFKDVRDKFGDIPVYHIGKTISTKEVRVIFNNVLVFNDELPYIRTNWESTNYQLELLQSNKDCANKEMFNLGKIPTSICNSKIKQRLNDFKKDGGRYNVAIIREEGSNGDREMAAAFEMAGFIVWDVTMDDLKNTPDLLDKFSGIAFVGGFSYSDVFGAAKGWHASIKYNQSIKKQFKRFYDRKDTFSIGVCNGCQLMSRLGWVRNSKFAENTSGKFESRFSYVKIKRSNAVMLKDMEDSVLGVWVAHKEGKCEIDRYDINTCINYVDENNNDTEEYPFNPNGSVDGITGLCSDDGRHLAMMPHPERCFLKWQLPYVDKDVNSLQKYSPWFLMFVNAYEWCKNN